MNLAKETNKDICKTDNLTLKKKLKKMLEDGENFHVCGLAELTLSKCFYYSTLYINAILHQTTKKKILKLM